MRKLIIVLLFISLISCKQSDKKETKIPDANNTENFILSPDQLKQSNVITGFISKQNFQKTISCAGNIEPTPKGLIYVTFPFAGTINQINKYTGQKVMKGEPLITIKNPEIIDLQEKYLTSLAEYGFLEKEYYRQKELAKENASTDKIVEKTYSLFQKEKAILQSLEAKLELLNLNPDILLKKGIQNQIIIYSPVNGYISRIKANPGKFFQPEETLMEIIDPEKLHLHLRIFEKDINNIKPGQKVKFSTLAEPNTKYTAEIFSLGHSINTENHTITAHANLLSRDKNLISGIFINAEIIMQKDSLWAVPIEGVIKKENYSYVFVEENRSFRKINVHTGIANDSLISLINPPESLIYSKMVLKGAYFINAAIEGSKEE